jgi:hypothetical protein
MNNKKKQGEGADDSLMELADKVNEKANKKPKQTKTPPPKTSKSKR